MAALANLMGVEEEIPDVRNYGRDLLKLVSKRLNRHDAHWKALDSNIKEIVADGHRHGVDSETLVNTANRNGKTALMHLCQLSDDPNLVQLLLGYKADPRRTTNRGHTALHYTASRSNPDVLWLLINAGASTKTCTVNGDSPLAILGTKSGVPAEDLAALLAHEEADTRPWQDFRENADALEAQKDHIKTCPNCQRKLRNATGARLPEEGVAVVVPPYPEDLDDLVTAAVVDGDSSRVADMLCGVVVHILSQEEGAARKELFQRMREELRTVAARCDTPEHVTTLLSASRRSSCLAALEAMGHETRGKRATRASDLAKGAVIAAVQNESESTLERIGLADLLRGADSDVAAKLACRVCPPEPSRKL